MNTDLIYSAAAFKISDADKARSFGPDERVAEYSLEAGERSVTLIVTTDEAEEFAEECRMDLNSDMPDGRIFCAFVSWLADNDKLDADAMRELAALPAEIRTPIYDWSLDACGRDQKTDAESVSKDYLKWLEASPVFNHHLDGSPLGCRKNLEEISFTALTAMLLQARRDEAMHVLGYEGMWKVYAPVQDEASAAAAFMALGSDRSRDAGKGR